MNWGDKMEIQFSIAHHVGTVNGVVVEVINFLARWLPSGHRMKAFDKVTGRILAVKKNRVWD